MPLILQEAEASVLVTDMRGFLALSEKLSPLELGLALGSYYEHVAGAVERHGGRVLKFLGDGVLALYLGGPHRDKALATLADLAGALPGWLADNAKVDLPHMDYAAGVASGVVLAGELGTDRVRAFDVIGATVNHAFRLCALALDRELPHLIDQSTAEKLKDRGALVEVEAAELFGRRHRLFRVEAPSPPARSPARSSAATSD